jgi:thiol-disulfide isomerase/thioredoxin
MALCCIGGVCIPYSAIIPLIIYGFRWLFQKLVTWGVLPSWISSALSGFICPIENRNNRPNKSDACFCIPRGNPAAAATTTTTSNENSLLVRKRRRSKHAKHTPALSTTSTPTETEDEDDSDGSVIFLKDFEQWNRLILAAASKKAAVVSGSREATIWICKFTASWCKPCQKIQPVFESLAQQYRQQQPPPLNGSKHTNNCMRFVSIDVDDDEEFQDWMGAYGVLTLPTFVAIQITNHHHHHSQTNHPFPRMMDKYSGSNAIQLTKFVETIAEKTK